MCERCECKLNQFIDRFKFKFESIKFKIKKEINKFLHPKPKMTEAEKQILNQFVVEDMLGLTSEAFTAPSNPSVLLQHRYNYFDVTKWLKIK